MMVKLFVRNVKNTLESLTEDDMSDDVKIETPKEKPAFTRKSDAGKGDAPRNVSKRFRDNWDEIRGFKKSKYK
jgi:hypothetical protein